MIHPSSMPKEQNNEQTSSLPQDQLCGTKSTLTDYELSAIHGGSQVLVVPQQFATST